MITIYLMLWIVSFACIFYSIRKKQGHITISELLIGALICLVPMFNIVIAFYTMVDTGILKKKL